MLFVFSDSSHARQHDHSQVRSHDFPYLFLKRSFSCFVLIETHRDHSRFPLPEKCRPRGGALGGLAKPAEGADRAPRSDRNHAKLHLVSGRARSRQPPGAGAYPSLQLRLIQKGRIKVTFGSLDDGPPQRANWEDWWQKVRASSSSSSRSS